MEKIVINFVSNQNYLLVQQIIADLITSLTLLIFLIN